MLDHNKSPAKQLALDLTFLTLLAAKITNSAAIVSCKLF
jgi:hypothetical protein